MAITPLTPVEHYSITPKGMDYYIFCMGWWMKTDEATFNMWGYGKAIIDPNKIKLS